MLKQVAFPHRLSCGCKVDIVEGALVVTDMTLPVGTGERGQRPGPSGGPPIMACPDGHESGSLYSVDLSPRHVVETVH